MVEDGMRDIRHLLPSFKRKAAQSLFFFTKGVLSYNFLVPHVHQQVCSFVQSEQTNEKLIVMPRGFLKTTICSVGYALWLAVHDPNLSILIASNVVTNATKIVGEIKRQLDSNVLLKALYPEVYPQSRNPFWSNERIELQRHGRVAGEPTFTAAGIGTKLTGNHYDVIIEDDTVAPRVDDMSGEEILPTREEIDKAIGFHSQCTYLKIHPAVDRHVVTGTRWAAEDLIHHCHKREKFPSLFMAAENAKGEPTYPERFNKKVLKRIKEKVSVYMFNTQYMNVVIDPSKRAFKSKWFKYYKELPPRAIPFCAVDPAIGADKRSDSTAISVIYRHGGGFFIEEYLVKRGMSVDGIIEEVFNFHQRHEFNTIGIESFQYQETIADALLDKSPPFMVKKLKSTKLSKDHRIMSMQPFFERGQVYMKKGMGLLEQQLIDYPDGKHDDLIDSLAYAFRISYRTRSKNPSDGKGNYVDPAFVFDIDEIRNVGIREKSLLLA